MISLELKIPENVKIDIDGKRVKVSGQKGEVERSFLEKEIKIEKLNDKISVSSESERKKAGALVGTIISHIKNMIEGAANGFTYRLRVVYSHFPITVKIEGNKVLIQNFLGERNPRVAKIIGNTQVKIEGSDLVITSVNIEAVGQTASNIEQATRIVGYDRRKFMDGIYIVERG
jgi:large subunit ribosomal protein L6